MNARVHHGWRCRYLVLALLSLRTISLTMVGAPCYRWLAASIPRAMALASGCDDAPPCLLGLLLVGQLGASPPSPALKASRFPSQHGKLAGDCLKEPV